MSADLIAKLTPELEANIRAGINWRYKDTVGTSSHERDALIGEIDRLRYALEAKEREIAELRAKHDELETFCKDEMNRSAERNKALRVERDSLAEQVKVLRDALEYIDSENASDEVLRRALLALATGDKL